MSTRRGERKREKAFAVGRAELVGGNETSETCARFRMICDLSWFVIVAVNGSRSPTGHYSDREVVLNRNLSRKSKGGMSRWSWLQNFDDLRRSQRVLVAEFAQHFVLATQIRVKTRLMTFAYRK